MSPRQRNPRRWRRQHLRCGPRERNVDGVVRERQIFCGRFQDIDPWETFAGGLHERDGGVHSDDGIRTESRDKFSGESSWPAADVECALAGVDTREAGELGGEEA